MNPVDDYVSELDLLGRKPSYLRSVSGAIRDFITNTGYEDVGDLDVSQVGERDIKAWLVAMRNRNMSDASIKRGVGHLNRFFAFVIESPDHNSITINPCTRIFKRLPSGRKQTRRPFKTVDEIGRVIKSAFNPRDRVIMAIFAKLGLRRGEAVGLNIEDIDIEARIMYVRHHYDDGARVLLDGRKNGVESTLPLDDETVKVLKVYLAVRQPVGGALFISRGGVRLNNGEIGKIVNEYVDKSGIAKNGERITPHYFRAWLTYSLTINGCKPEIVQVIRGDVADTMANFYTREILSFDDVRREYLKAVPVFGI